MQSLFYKKVGNVTRKLLNTSSHETLATQCCVVQLIGSCSWSQGLQRVLCYAMKTHIVRVRRRLAELMPSPVLEIEPQASLVHSGQVL